MKSRDFCYWLQGYFELHDKAKGLNDKQVKAIKSHLAMVFKHEIDPSFGGKDEQDGLDHLHSQGSGPLIRC